MIYSPHEEQGKYNHADEDDQPMDKHIESELRQRIFFVDHVRHGTFIHDENRHFGI